MSNLPDVSLTEETHHHLQSKLHVRPRHLSGGATNRISQPRPSDSFTEVEVTGRDEHHGG